MPEQRFPRKIGLVVNPVAGVGGAVGLQGSDGPEIIAEAVRRGARPVAGERAARALKTFAAQRASATIVTVPGAMGEEYARTAGFTPVLVGPAATGATTAEDTRASAKRLLDAGIDFLLFAGGDGTARDILDAVGVRCPVLGIPAGVKMQSAVFAVTPEAAGRCAAAFLDGRAALREAEVMDIDEAERRKGRLAARLYGVMRAPVEHTLMQSAKAGSSGPPDGLLRAACVELARTLAPDVVTLVGPGATTRIFLDALGLEGTLLGIDAVAGGRLIGRDLSEDEILSLIDGRNAALVVGVVGGQGALFGRGNQPLGPRVLARIPRERIVILAALDKLVSLNPPRLFVDTGDAETDATLAGYWPVMTAPGRTMMMRVAA